MSHRPPTIEDWKNLGADAPGAPLPVAPGTADTLPLVEELPPSLEAWEAARRLSGLRRFLFLDSAATDSPWGSCSFVTGDPFHLLHHHRPGQLDPFPLIKQELARYRAETVPGLPPFQGGAAGLFGYDLCHYIERLPRPRFDEFRLPELCLGFYDWVLAFDHRRGRSWLISTGFPETEPSRRRERASRRLRQVQAMLACQPVAPRWTRSNPLMADQLCRQYPLEGHPGVTSNFDRPGYLALVRRGIEYIHAGDCFQVNLAQRLLVPETMPPLELYARLRQRNAAPFAGFMDLGDFAILSASPERFLRVDDHEVETRPIKGTRPRGATPQEDEARQCELLSSPKDRAENVMIVDLLRNDLGRVCSYGSVRVEAVCRLESFRYVHHLVSEVRGRLRPGMGPVDLLRAAFPGGSVTGAPKVRAMQ